jgi:hypothetical protein
MSKPLLRLIYCSRQRIIVPERLDYEIGEIVKTSVRNNREAGVTGLLLAHQGWFLQVLEGAPVRVQTLYGRIVDDNRHVSSQVISATLVSKRLFGEWDMCARRLRPEDDAILGVLDARGVFDPTRFAARTALRLLLAVRKIRVRRSSSYAHTMTNASAKAAMELD